MSFRSGNIIFFYKQPHFLIPLIPQGVPACTNGELKILTFIVRAGGGVNGKMHGNPAKQQQAVCMTQFAPMPKNKNTTARKIASYTICLDFRIFPERVEASFVLEFLLLLFQYKSRESKNRNERPQPHKLSFPDGYREPRH